jgi:hypothetical protein
MGLSYDRQQKYSFHRNQQGCNRTEGSVIRTVKERWKTVLINKSFVVSLSLSL